MSNALHDYAELFEKYAADNGGTGAILAGEDCLALANEMRMDADAIDAENARLRELVRWMYDCMDESCAVQHPYAPAPISYDQLMQAATRARELGIKVDE